MNSYLVILIAAAVLAGAGVLAWKGIQRRASRLDRLLVGSWRDVPPGEPNWRMQLVVERVNSDLMGYILAAGRRVDLRVIVKPEISSFTLTILQLKGYSFDRVGTVRLRHHGQEDRLHWHLVGLEVSGTLPRRSVLWRHGDPP